MTKQEARKYFLNQRNLLSENTIQEYSLAIIDQIKNSTILRSNTFHIFLSIQEKKEVDTNEIIKFLWKNNKKVYVSKVEGNILRHYNFLPETKLKKSKWGILEPYNENPITIDRLECIFLPLLAYDLRGNRVGYGKGYYDRFVKNYPKAEKIGLSFFNPVTKIEDLHMEDVPMDSIITQNRYSGFPMYEK